MADQPVLNWEYNGTIADIDSRRSCGPAVLEYPLLAAKGDCGSANDAATESVSAHFVDARNPRRMQSPAASSTAALAHLDHRTSSSRFPNFSIAVKRVD